MPYFHVVFTLPASISNIAYHNKAVIYDLLFKASAETLITIAADPKHLGARVGITSVLHTWGSAMTHHPHVHMIVPGGGISLDGERWVACRSGFNSRRNRRESTRTGRKKPDRHATQRSPSREMPPPGTIMWMCG